METITLADYILYGFLAFIALMQVAIVVALWRQGRDIVELKGEISETKGLILALHERVDLVMRHRHQPDTGQVILTPEEVAAD